MNSWDTLGLVAFLILVGYVFKLIVDHRMRMKLIDKNMVDENIKHLFTEGSQSQFLSSLKWGMVLIGVGLAAFIGRLIPDDPDRVITFGAMLVLAGLGLLLYYFIINKKFKRDSNS